VARDLAQTGVSTYLDFNSSTPVDPAVIEAVVKSMRDVVANTSSTHPPGVLAFEEIQQGRDEVGTLIGCPPAWLTFTSGATEANNLAIKGLWDGMQSGARTRDTIVVGATEHSAVLQAARSLEARGARILVAPVDEYGIILEDALKSLVDERTLLVSVMAANNETGSITDLSKVSAIAKASGAYIHSDATQYVGKLPFDMLSADADLVSISAHKLYGPKGVGALAVARGTPVAPLFHGGGHEKGLRAGTLNTPGIVGLGVAARLALARFHEADPIRVLRDRLHSGLKARIDGMTLNGHPSERLPNTLNVRFAGVDADALVASLDCVHCSTGSACHSGSPEPSHVLLAMGLGRIEAHESIRLSLGRTTTVLEVDAAIEDLVRAVRRLREMTGSPVSRDRISA